MCCGVCGRETHAEDRYLISRLLGETRQNVSKAAAFLAHLLARMHICTGVRTHALEHAPSPCPSPLLPQNYTRTSENIRSQHSCEQRSALERRASSALHLRASMCGWGRHAVDSLCRWTRTGRRAAYGGTVVGGADTSAGESLA